MQKQGRSKQSLLPFFDSIAAYFSGKHPNYTPYLGDFSGKHPNYTLYLGDFWEKHPNYTPYLGGFSGKHPNYTPYLGGFWEKHPNYTPYLGGFGYREAASHLFFKADAMTSYCIGFGNEGKEATDSCYKPST